MGFNFILLAIYVKITNPKVTKIKIFNPKDDESFLNTLILFLLLTLLCIFGLSRQAVSVALFLTVFYGVFKNLFVSIACYTFLGYLYNVYYLFLSSQIKQPLLTSFSPYLFFISLICSLSVTLIESVESYADKRFATLLVLSTVYTIFLIYIPNINIPQLAIAFFISFLLSLFALKAKVADRTGLISATIVGLIVIVFTNLKLFVVLLLFYAFGSIFTKYKYDLKLKLNIAEPSGGARGCSNVFGNSLAPLFFAMNYGVYRSELFLLAFISSVATALGDTLASEIGKTSRKVYLITSFKRVKAGESGGVSAIGEVGALLGVFIIIFGSFLMNLLNNINDALLVVIASMIAIHIDSLLGATLERRGLITNFCVNLLATLSGGLLLIFFHFLVYF